MSSMNPRNHPDFVQGFIDGLRSSMGGQKTSLNFLMGQLIDYL